MVAPAERARAVIGAALLAGLLCGCFQDSGGGGGLSAGAPSMTAGAETTAGSVASEATSSVTTGQATLDTSGETAGDSSGGTGSAETEDAGSSSAASVGSSSSTSSATSGSTSGSTSTATTTDPEPPDCSQYGNQLAMSSTCVDGFDLVSSAVGDELCKSEFGETWKWLEFHDDGPWQADGEWVDEVGAGERGWVWINNQDANCFDAGNEFGMTWYRAGDPTCRATCNSVVGLEGPEFMPYQGTKCGAYSGDTPCTMCRRLVCFLPG